MRSFLLLLVFPAALASWSVPAGAADSLGAGSASDFMEAGRKLYVAKCARCHKFYDPAKYSETAWRDWMEKMSKKAKLKGDQKEILSKYLDTFRSQVKTNGTR